MTTEPNASALRAIDAYRNEARFRAIVQSVVHDVLRERGPIDPERAEKDAYTIATETAARLLQRVYEDDAELNAQKHIADTYKKFAEESAGIRPMTPIIFGERAK